MPPTADKRALEKVIYALDYERNGNRPNCELKPRMGRMLTGFDYAECMFCEIDFKGAHFADIVDNEVNRAV